MNDSGIRVMLVDEDDDVIGSMEKMEAHRNGGSLHRAVSVFVTDSCGQWLIHRRALDKYHSKGLWSNTSCSHPAPGEDTVEAARRRLFEEMGLRAEPRYLFRFTYKAQLEDGLTEYETDHVFWAVTDVEPHLNPDEVMDYKYIEYRDLELELQQNPECFSEWFKMIYQQVQQHIKKYDV